jgi:hypothetical protein
MISLNRTPTQEELPPRIEVIESDDINTTIKRMAIPERNTMDIVYPPN